MTHGPSPAPAPARGPEPASSSSHRPPPRDAPRRPAPRHVRLLLWVFDRLAPLVAVAGLHAPSVRELLRVRLLVEARRQRTGEGGFSMMGKAGLPLLLLFDLAVGTILATLIVLVPEPLPTLSLVMATVTMLTALPLTIDFAHLLVDTSDLSIVSTLPVDERAVFASRALHVGFYTGLILGALTLPGLVVLPFVHGWPAVPAYLAAVTLAGALLVMTTTLLFLTALRVFDVSRFKNVLVTMQVLMVVVFFGGLHLGPRLVDTDVVLALVEERSPWLATLPPCWFAGLVSWATPARGDLDLLLGALALAVPLVVFVITRQLAGEGVLRRLATLASASGGTRRARPPRGLTGRLGLGRWLRGPERAGFTFFLGTAAGERGYTMRVLPGFAVAFLPFAAILLDANDTQLTQAMPFVVDVLPFLVLTAVVHLRWSDVPEASAMLGELDAEERSRFVRGALNAVLVRFFVWPGLGCLVLVLALLGPSSLPDLTLGTGACALVSTLSARLLVGTLPFSSRFRGKEAGAQTLMAMVLLFALLVAVGVQLGVAALDPHGHGRLATGLALLVIAIVHARRMRPAIAPLGARAR